MTPPTLVTARVGTAHEVVRTLARGGVVRHPTDGVSGARVGHAARVDAGAVPARLCDRALRVVRAARGLGGRCVTQVRGQQRSAPRRACGGQVTAQSRRRSCTHTHAYAHGRGMLLTQDGLVTQDVED